MSQYKKIIPKLNKYLQKDSIITDVGSTKSNVDLLINKKLDKSFKLDNESIQLQDLR